MITLCTVFDFGDCTIDICLLVLYCVVSFVCVLCAPPLDKFHVRLLYDRICGPIIWYVCIDKWVRLKCWRISDFTAKFNMHFKITEPYYKYHIKVQLLTFYICTNCFNYCYFIKFFTAHSHVTLEYLNFYTRYQYVSLIHLMSKKHQISFSHKYITLL
jgi:hypothetical protein